MAYNLGNVKPHVAAAAEEIGKKFGYTNIGGYRRIGSVPNSDHPKGLALDFMTFSKEKGDATVAYVIANASRLGVTYVIYWGRIWQGGTWKRYDGPSPHIDHVHVSFSESASGSGPSTTPVGLPGLPNIPLIGDLEELAGILTDPEKWKRAGLMALGAAVVVGGIFALVRPQVLGATKTVVEVIK
jgi:hypothetical protein